jgi:hypothetical protein
MGFVEKMPHWLPVAPMPGTVIMRRTSASSRAALMTLAETTFSRLAIEACVAISGSRGLMFRRSKAGAIPSSTLRRDRFFRRLQASLVSPHIRSSDGSQDSNGAPDADRHSSKVK